MSTWRSLVLSTWLANPRTHSIAYLHGGAFTKAPPRTSGWLVRRKALDELWMTNERMQAGAAGILPNLRMRLVAPVLSFHAKPASEASLARVGPNRETRVVVAVRSESAQLYGLEVAFAAIRLLEGLGQKLGVDVIVYGDGAESLAVPTTSRCPVRVHRNVGSGEVARLLESATALLRPTKTDGDSRMVREALAAGVRVLASDVVPRPRGVEVVRGDHPDAWVRAFMSGGDLADGHGLGHPIDESLLQLVERL